MRFYSINITNAQTGKPVLDAFGNPFGPYSSTSDGTVTGKNLPGALQIQLDLPVSVFHLPVSSAALKIWGIGLPTLAQASQFNPTPDFSSYCNIQIYGGMRAGLPLANPKQAGLLINGAIWQAFGNWQGTEQTLDFVIGANGGNAGGYGTPAQPKNIVFNWEIGQQLGEAVQNALQSAFPNAKITGTSSLNQTLTLPYAPQTGIYQTVGQFAEYINDLSQNIINANSGGNYQGIQICPSQNGFNLFDGNTATPPTQIQFTDLIGQPTWLNLTTINFKTVMRADLQVGDYIKMPQGPQINTAQSMSQYRNRAAFQGIFQIIAMRHMGNFRQNSGDSWVTSFDAYVSSVT